MSILHQKVSALADGSDPTKVQPSDWNAAHVFNPALTGILADPAGNNNFVGVAASAAGQYLRRKRNVASVTYEFANQSHRVSSEYAFSSSFAQTISPGAVSLTFSALPEGLTAASPNKHYLRITDAVGGNENVLVTSVVGSTVTFNAALSHASGNWTIGSATAGVQEAVYVAGVGGYVFVPPGTHTWHTKVFVPNQLTMFGLDAFSTRIQATFNSGNVVECLWTSGASSLFFANLRFAPSAAMVSGAMIYAEGYTDGTFSNLIFDGPYVGIDWLATWAGNVPLYSGLSFFNTQAISIRLRSTGSGQCAALFDSIYADGKTTFDISGTIAGITANNLWLQNIDYAFIITATTGRPTNEVNISNFIFDGCNIAGFVVQATGTGWTNSIRFENGLVQHIGYGGIVTAIKQVTLSNITFNSARSNTGVALDGSTNTIIANCRFCASAAVTEAIALLGICTDIKILGNVIEGRDGGLYARGIRLADVAHTGVVVQGNSIRATDPIFHNASINMPIMQGNELGTVPPTIASAATIQLPARDNDALIELTGTTTITRILGGYANRSVRFYTTGALSFNTGGANPGNIAANFGPTTAGQLVIASYNSSNGLWYLR